VLLCDQGTITLAQLPVEKMSASFAPRRIISPVRTTTRQADQEGDETPALEPPSAPSGESPDDHPYPTQDPESPLRRKRGLQIPHDLQREVLARERKQIVDALSACAGNQTGAAKILGISRRTLVNRLNFHSIPGPRKNRRPAV
jgi:DNA-binding NtrC family response regulator